VSTKVRNANVPVTRCSELRRHSCYLVRVLRSSALHWATLSLALGTLLATACGETSEDNGAGASGQAGTATSGGGAGKGGSGGSSAGSSAGKGGSTSSGGASTGGTSSNGGAGTGGTSSNAGSGGTSGAGSSGDGGSENDGRNDCDPRKITCRRSAPVCDEGEAPSVEGTCYGPCVPIATCACSSADACPLPEMFTCHLSRGRCDYYVR
jgi:hypothetical protein